MCTGNICRSPMAEHMLRARLADRGVDATVSSTGLVGEGRSVPSESLTVMGRSGFDLTTHRSTLLSAAAVERADLVIGLERQHVREAVVLVPASFGRAFTLKELVRRGEQVGPRRPDESLASWLRRLGGGRTVAMLVGMDDRDDVADPFGRSVGDYERTRAELTGLIDRLADLMAPAAGVRSA